MQPVQVEGVEQLKGLVGRELGPTEWVEITQEDVDKFADVSRDHQWIHVDRERAAAESPYGTTVAHGNLTLSLLDHFRPQLIENRGVKMGINYGLNRVRFVSPVRAGARIRTHSKVAAVEDFPGGLQVTWQINVELEGSDKPALVAEWLTRMYL